MASSYSPLKIELMATGENSGTWGDITNTNLGTALEEAIVGRATANFSSDADLTLTLTNTNGTQVARHFVLNVTSGVSLSATRNLVVPAINKPYLVQNNTTGGQSIIVKNTTGTGVTVPNGREVFVYNDGTNVVSAIDHIPSLTLGAALPVASGGTGALTLTSGAYLKGNGTSAVSFQAAPIPTTDGGTGLTSFTTNGAVYATSTSALATGTLPVASGGTGALTLTSGAYLKGNGTSAVSFQAAPIPVADGGTGATTLSGVLIGNGASAFTVKTNPSGAFVGTTDTQTLTNKTFTGYTETVFAVSGTTPALSPTNGTIQTWTLSGASTPTAGTWASGQSITLMIDDGSAFTITWTSATFGGSGVVWKTDGGVAPTLNTTGFTAIVLWKVDTQVYGARVGDA